MNRKGQQRRTKINWAYKKLPITRQVSISLEMPIDRIIQNTPNVEIPKRKFSLLSNL
jgi:hypothetical protein